MINERIAHIRAYLVRGGGADYHDQAQGHWIDNHIATPMSGYPEYRESRQSFGVNVLGTVIVEAEADDGTIGFAVTTGGEPAAYVIERHLAGLLEGRRPSHHERNWDIMYRSTIFYGRRGLVLNAISGVDLALYDLVGRLRELPVFELLGGPVRDEISFYATGPRPDVAESLGFLGGKMPLHHAPAKGEGGLRANLAELERMRSAVDDDFLLMLDCWMSLDVEYAVRLVDRAAEMRLSWLEEPLLPDDYWGHGELRSRMSPNVRLAAGEHEATRWGFRQLLELGRVDVIQPDVGWCGGLTELRRIAAIADSYGAAVIPHGSSVYSYHFVVTCPNSPYAEFLMMHPEGTEIIPMFSPMLRGEPVPENGRLTLSNAPGFGVELDGGLDRVRPYSH